MKGGDLRGWCIRLQVILAIRVVIETMTLFLSSKLAAVPHLQITFRKRSQDIYIVPVSLSGEPGLSIFVIQSTYSG